MASETPKTAVEVAEEAATAAHDAEVLAESLAPEAPAAPAAEAAPADFEDVADSTGNVWRKFADGRVELQPAKPSIR